MQMDKQTRTMLMIGGGAAVLYYLYQSGALSSLFGGSAVAASAPAALPTYAQPLPSQMPNLDNYGSDYNATTGEYQGAGTTPNFP
jgi:hypothetical protein